MDIARGELVEKELDALIERRSRKEPDPAEREALWKASVRRHHETIRRRNKALWYGWHMDQAERHRRALEALIDHHETQAARLCQEGTP